MIVILKFLCFINSLKKSDDINTLTIQMYKLTFVKPFLGSCFVCFDRRSFIGTQLAVHLVCFPANTSPQLAYSHRTKEYVMFGLFLLDVRRSLSTLADKSLLFIL